LFRGDYLAWTLQANHQRDDWEPVPAKRKRKRYAVEMARRQQ
jgi:hypothetical protein